LSSIHGRELTQVSGWGPSISEEPLDSVDVWKRGAACVDALVSEEKGKANHPDSHDADREWQQRIDYCRADAVAENVQASHDEMIEGRRLYGKN
jgi:hypothetical protein